MLKLGVTHPEELRALIAFRLWYEKKRDIAAQEEHETSGWDRESMRRCWTFLDKTSRSFSAVIKELDGDLARIICLYYLVLRGLDTVEDDTSLPDEVKQPILRSFHTKLSAPGWTYNGVRQEEKDRQLLVEFDIVIDEVMRLEPRYKDPITDITRKMATGMADFCHRADTKSQFGVETLEEYDLYCHYVAGLVGEGLSRLFSASGKEAPWLGDELVLSNSMGMLLQKTNILRDYREDVDTNRLFWPRELWARYGFAHPQELHDPKNEERALFALSEMTLDALRHVPDALDYLTLLKNQSVFNFCAIPATMAIATLETCFMNTNVLHRNVKIRKGQAVQLIMRSTNPREVALIFRDYARKIHTKARISDPNYMALCIMCGKIEQWVERHYPSFVSIQTSPTAEGVQASIVSTDPRARILQRDQMLERKKRGGAGQAAAADQSGFMWELVVFVLLGMVVIVGMGVAIAWFVATYLAD
ncbi:farnesyl-diphosphate farnesyltransferase [Hysterangium stoloniferum]|nr:farnesyl-diphosphate farnesyltransferase [Hysterangium stoloniferum]